MKFVSYGEYCKLKIRVSSSEQLHSYVVVSILLLMKLVSCSQLNIGDRISERNKVSQRQSMVKSFKQHVSTEAIVFSTIKVYSLFRKAFIEPFLFKLEARLSITVALFSSKPSEIFV